MKSSIEKLYEWSKDRPLVTSELHSSNDFYGHAALLKKYAGIPSNYQIKAAIEHGPFPPGRVWDVDFKSSLPAMLVYGAYRYPTLKEKTNKALFSTGPIIRYAPHFLDNHTLSLEKQRIGETLLVFPHHSTHWIDANYDIHRYCRILEDIGKEFNTVMVCIYWKDVLRGTAEKYMEHGFECVTAGHIYDPLFLPRLKSIIELATISTSCSYGTHVCCCIAMGKPHFVIENKVKRTAASDEILRRDIAPQTEKTAIWASQMKDAFSKIRSDISQKQNEIANKYWGFSEFKTTAEMRLIFQATEDMYKKGRNFYMSDRDILTEQALDYLNSNDNKKASFLLNQSIAVNPDVPELNYGKAIALCRLDQMDDATKTLSDLLAVVPDHEKGLFLLQELKKKYKTRFNLGNKPTSNGKRSKTKVNSRLLNLGCGNRYHPNWTNVDFRSTGEGVIAHNLTEGLPFENNSFDVVYHSHLLEHFPKSHALFFLNQCFRVLKSGGIIRVVVPDLEQIVKLYLSSLEKSLMGDEEARKRYEWIMLELFDQIVRNVSGGEMLKYWKQDSMPAESFVIERMGSEVLNVITNIRNYKNRYIENPKEKSLSTPQKIGEFRLSGEIHQWMYDRYSLEVLLREVGFKDVKVCLADESQILNFNSYLLDIESDGAVRKPDSLFMEGMKNINEVH